MASTPEDWFRQLPKVTKAYMVGALATTVAVQFLGVSFLNLHWDPTQTVTRFQFWRPLTAFLFLGNFSLSFLFTMFILCAARRARSPRAAAAHAPPLARSVRYSTALEKNPYAPRGGMGTSADYALMFLFGTLVMLAAGALLGYPFLGHGLVFMVLYVWSRRNAEAQLSFWGASAPPRPPPRLAALTSAAAAGLPMQGVHLPWAMMTLSLLMGNSIVMDIMGILTGHLYFFLVDAAPAAYGKHLLFTPQFLRDLLGEVGPARAPGAARAGPRHWGRGHQLG